jgi:hypothetical protein
VDVVRAAKNREIVDRRRAAPREGLPVLDGEEASLLTAPDLRVDKGALKPIPFENLTRDLARYVPRSGFQRPRLARLAGSEAALRLVLDEPVESALEDLGDVAARDRVASAGAPTFSVDEHLCLVVGESQSSGVASEGRRGGAAHAKHGA